MLNHDQEDSVIIIYHEQDDSVIITYHEQDDNVIGMLDDIELFTA